MNNYTDQEIKELIELKVQEVYKLGKEKFHVKKDSVYVEFNIKGSVGGRAVLQLNIVRVNLTLAKENLDDYLNSTIPHEVAHLIKYQIYPKDRNWHDSFWKYICITLGGSGKMYHDYLVTENRIKYICQGCKKEFYVSKVIDTKIRNGQKRICPNCRSIVVSELELNLEGF